MSFYVFVWHAATTELLDFSIYMRAGERLNSNLGIYEHVYQEKIDDGRVFQLRYYYPPFLAMFLGLAQRLGTFETIKFAWCGLSFFCILLSALGLQRLSRGGALSTFPPVWQGAGFLLLITCFEPVYTGIRDGQVHLIILCLLVWYLVFARQHKDFAAGLLLGFAALIKMSPALLLLGWLRPFRPQVFLGFFSAILVSGIFLWIAPYNFDLVKDFFKPFGPLITGSLERDFVFNFAFDKAILGALGLDHIESLRWILKLSVIVLPLALVGLWKSKDQESHLRLHAVLICCMVLASPIIWFHHLTWLLIPLVIALRQNIADKQLRYKFWTNCAGIFFVLSETNLFHFLAMTQQASVLPLTTLVPTGGILWLLVVLIQLERKSRAHSNPA